jgi:farnesyl diphosphate synthase
MLRETFRDDTFYAGLLEQINETTFALDLGEMVERITSPPFGKMRVTFSFDRYSFIVANKTSYNTFYLPVDLAMHMAGVGSDSNLETAKNILLPLGEYATAQKEMLVCPHLRQFRSLLHKCIEDIQDHKCTWTINAALEDQSQPIAVLVEKYGKRDAEASDRVMEIFADVDLNHKFRNYAATLSLKLELAIGNIDEEQGLKQEVFRTLWQKVFKYGATDKEDGKA